MKNLITHPNFCPFKKDISELVAAVKKANSWLYHYYMTSYFLDREQSIARGQKPHLY